MKKKKIVIAMSGGVDSSVAAILLKKAGFDVLGIFMKFWNPSTSLRTSSLRSSEQDSENRCCSVESEKLARLVANQIEIPFYVLNVEKEFKKRVVDYFLKEYRSGNTPNPCVACNKEIKFGILIDKALKLGADFVATGHYAQKKNKKLLKGRDKNKDQSYFLWQLNQKQLNKVLFPVGSYTKPKVRKLAKKFNLPTAQTPESQEVCFIVDSTNDFLKKYLKIKQGNIVDINGKIIGQHQGLWFYTIGQRKGLEISQGPWYVVSKDFKKNILIVSKNEKDLVKKELVVKNVNWIAGQEPKLPIRAEVKIRYKSAFVKSKITNYKKNKVKIIFEKPQTAITPGQSAVFYSGQELLGGGIIN